MVMFIQVAGILLGMATSALADRTCKMNAFDRKLAGVAMNSFMKNWQTDATKRCADQAATKKLAVAAKTSFIKDA